MAEKCVPKLPIVPYQTHGHPDVVFVSDGISRGRSWGTFYRLPSGSLRRLVRKSLPMRVTRDEAQADLDAYAKEIGWKPWSPPSEPAEPNPHGLATTAPRNREV